MRPKASLISVIAGLLGAVLLSTPTAVDIEEQFGLPWLFALRGQLEAPTGAAILAIDDTSVDWLQRSAANLAEAAPGLTDCLSEPGVQTLASAKSVSDLPRDFYVCLIGRLKAYQPSLIVIDVNFSLPKAADDLLAAEMRRNGSVILVEGVKTIFDRQGELAAIVRERPSRPILDQALASGAFHVGAGDNRMTTWYLGEFRPFVDIDPIPVIAARHVGAATTTVDAFQRLWFYGPPGSVRRVSAREILREDAKRLFLEGAVIFVGYDTRGVAGARDHFPVPLRSVQAARMSGVEIAATAFLNLRDGHVLRELGDAPLFAAKFLIVLMFTAIALGRPLRRKLYLIFGGGGVLLALTVALFFNLYYVAIILPLLASMALATIVLLSRRLYLAQASTRALAPAQIADQMMDGAAYSENTGTASVLFLDLVGSTALAQSLPSEEYSRTIREYYGIVGEQVEKVGGLLLEFRGDGILAAFQRTTIGPGYAAAACQAVRQIRDVIDQRAKAERRISHIRVRGGMATGEVTMSSAAAGERVILTMAGDIVNAAARIEQLGKELFEERQDNKHLVCLVDETTRIESHLPAANFLFHGVEQLRGRSVSTSLYELKFDQ